MVSDLFRNLFQQYLAPNVMDSARAEIDRTAEKLGEMTKIVDKCKIGTAQKDKEIEKLTKILTEVFKRQINLTGDVQSKVNEEIDVLMRIDGGHEAVPNIAEIKKIFAEFLLQNEQLKQDLKEEKYDGM